MGLNEKKRTATARHKTKEKQEKNLFEKIKLN